MRNRSFNTAMVGIIAATVAFTAVPAQSSFASGANAKIQTAKEAGSKNDAYWFRNPNGSREHCKADVWGYELDC